MPEETLTRIRQHLETLKLLGIQKVLNQELARAAQQALPSTELLERLLAIEANARIERRIERRIKESRLPERKLLSEFDFAFQTGLDKAQVLELAKLDFVERKQGLVIAGNLTNRAIRRRDGAEALEEGNFTKAGAELFPNLASGDLHLAERAAAGLPKVRTREDCPLDAAGRRRPPGGETLPGADGMLPPEEAPGK